MLEDAGVLGDVSVEEFPLYFIHLEQDVLSLELEKSFGDLYLVRSVPSFSRGALLTKGSEKIRHVFSLLLVH